MAKKQKEEIKEEEIVEDENDTRVYELGFHLNPELPSEEVKKAYQEIRELIAAGNTLAAEGEPQMLQLSYTISRQETSGRRDFDSAYFSWIVYEASASNHAEVLRAASADKRIIRFIDLLTTKDAARHFTEIHALSAKSSERSENSETNADAELDAALASATV